MKTPQPVFPYLTNCHTSFSDYCKCQPIMVHPTCNTTNSTIAENSWGSKLENVLVNSTWHYLYHPCHIWQMSILNDSSNFWNFYFWKKHCCCGNGGGMSQMSSGCIDRKRFDLWIFCRNYFLSFVLTKNVRSKKIDK